jgi:hypothetical protein
MLSIPLLAYEAEALLFSEFSAFRDVKDTFHGSVSTAVGHHRHGFQLISLISTGTT